jgi:hypothetical protein
MPEEPKKPFEEIKIKAETDHDKQLLRTSFQIALSQEGEAKTQKNMQSCKPS